MFYEKEKDIVPVPVPVPVPGVVLLPEPDEELPEEEVVETVSGTLAV